MRRLRDIAETLLVIALLAPWLVEEEIRARRLARRQRRNR